MASMRDRLPTILFVTYGGGHVAMVLPVVRHLLREGLASPVVLALTTASEDCRRAGVPHLGFKDFMPDDDERLYQLGAALIDGQAIHPLVGREESLAYYALSYADLIERLGDREARRQYEQDGRGSFLPLSVLERIVDRVEPDLVVATNSPRAERAALLVGRQRGIRTCCLVDVFGVRSDWLMEPGVADRICVMNDRVRELFIARGQEPSIVLATGNPAFDSLAEVRRRRSQRSRGQEYRVLWAPHPEPAVSPVDPSRHGDQGLNDRIAAVLQLCAERHPDWTIVVRPHPSQGLMQIESSANLIVSAAEELDDRLVWADTVVTCASTVGLQASIAGVPTVAVEGSVVSSYVPLADYGLALGVGLDGLETLLADLRGSARSSTPGGEYIGQATERVAAELLRLVYM